MPSSLLARAMSALSPGRARLAEARREAEHAKDQVTRARAKLERELEHAARQRDKARDDALTLIGDLRRRLDEWRRMRPTTEVLEQSLSPRARVLPLMADEREAAAIREKRFAEASPAYAACRHTLNDTRAEMGRVEIYGTGWWVPSDPRAPDRLERAARQTLPLRAILQTRELPLGGVMLDLGANIGRTSIPRLLLGDFRVVYAAEPEPANFGCLVRNVVEFGLQGLLLPDQVAIGAVRGEVTLRRSRYPGGHSVLTRPAKTTEEVIAVPQWPLDDWIEHVGVETDAVTFVKVDTQGAELNVLAGAPHVLARRRAAWQVEVDLGLLRAAGVEVRDLFAMLERHFTHFIDIGTRRPGDHIQPTSALGESLAYVGTEQKKTDLLLYCSAPA